MIKKGLNLGLRQTTLSRHQIKCIAVSFPPEKYIETREIYVATLCVLHFYQNKCVAM